MTKRKQPLKPVTHEDVERETDEQHLDRSLPVEWFISRVYQHRPESYERLRARNRPYAPRYGIPDTERRNAAGATSRWVNYTREAQDPKGKRQNWPDVLNAGCIDGETTGDVLDLIAAITAEYGDNAVSWEFHWTAPGDRVLGRENIGRYLGIGAWELNRRLRLDPVVRERIFRIVGVKNGLLVACRADLEHVASHLNKLAHRNRVRAPGAVSVRKRKRFKVRAPKQVM